MAELTQHEAEAGADPGEAAEPPADSGRADVCSITLTTANRFVGRFELDQDVITIGRDRSSDLHLDEDIVSRRHAEIRRNDGLYALVVHSKSNPTFLNGKEVQGMSLLNDGDGIGIGRYRLRFQAETAQGLDFDIEGGEEVGERGGMTVQMSPRAARRIAADYDRARAYLTIPRRGRSPLRLFVAETFQVGKGSGCELVIRGWFAPRKAAIIARGYDRYTLINTSPSDRSVLVNEKPVSDRRILTHGDWIEVYGERFLFEQPNPEDEPEAQAVRAAAAEE